MSRDKIVYQGYDIFGNVKYVGRGNPGRDKQSADERGFAKTRVIKSGLTDKEARDFEKKTIEKRLDEGANLLNKQHNPNKK